VRLVMKNSLPTDKFNRSVFMTDIRGIYDKGRQLGAEGLAMSMPGILDARRGFMYTGGSLTFIHDEDMAQNISRLCDGVKVTIENDAKAAARAEMADGALAGIRDAVIILVGTGVGGAVINDGRIMRGSHFFAGELSFMSDDAEGNRLAPHFIGITCSVTGLIHEYALAAHRAVTKVDGRTVFDQLAKGDVKAEVAIRRLARRIAALILNLQCVVDPEVVAIGGAVSIQPRLIDLIGQELAAVRASNIVVSHAMPTVRVVACRHHNDANLLGAYRWYQEHDEEANG